MTTDGGCCFSVLERARRLLFRHENEEERSALVTPPPRPEEASALTTSPSPPTTTKILMEVVGAMGLNLSSQQKKRIIDPYCVVKVKQKHVHRTKTIRNDGNPVWTAATHSLCILNIDNNDEAAAVSASDSENDNDDNNNKKSVTVEVCSGSKCLGRVTLPYQTVLQQATGERLEYDIIQSLGSSASSIIIISPNATLALRFRRATRDDLLFLERKIMQKQRNEPSSTNDKSRLASDINFRSVRGSNSSNVIVPFQSSSSSSRRNREGVKRFRVKPYPDPDRPQETEWMTHEEIQQQALKPSTKWVSAGYGTVGTIHLEIIGCDKLVNLDATAATAAATATGLGIINDKTDAFVAIVFEDNMLRTDVIWDNLNPRWMPWTTRAFCLKVRHPASLLLLGVFDYDQQIINDHDPVGRVVINTANFQCDTTYLLHYKLCHDPREQQQDSNKGGSSSSSRGNIIIRLRIEWKSESDAIKLSFTKQPRLIINVDNDKSFHVLRYLTRGAIDVEQSSMTTVKMYANELVSYWDNYCYFLDVLLEVLLWRGRLRLGNNSSWSVWFPIHSVALFVAITSMIEFPHKIVPILLLFCAWIMLSINYHASQNPCPWKQVKSFKQTNMIAICGGGGGRSFFDSSVRIKPGQGQKEAKRLEKLDQLKAARMSALIQALLSFGLAVKSIYSKTSASSIKITTEVKKWSLLSGRLHGVHMLLMTLCTNIRLFRNLINWKGYMAGKLTTYCLMVGTVWLAFPVDHVARWVLRIVAWTLLGPWMKLLDIYWFRSWYKTKEELLEDIDNDRGSIGSQNLPNFDAVIESDFFKKLGKRGRIVAEDAYKLKDMRTIMFGRYSERVPDVDSSRYLSVPLPESLAYPSKESTDKKEHWYHVPGQRLQGTMILRTEATKQVEPEDGKEVEEEIDLGYVF